MLFFVARRLLYLIPVLIAVSLLTFFIASLLPGDLAYVILGDQATPENVAALRKDMGLDQPVWIRYFGWLGNILQGDFGRSFRTGQTVLQAVTERLPVSFELMILAEIMGLVDRRSPGDRLRRPQRRRVRSLHDRQRLRHAFGAGLPVGDPADLSVCGGTALVAGDGLCAICRRPRRKFALHGAACADAGARRMAGDHAGAAIGHDRNPAGRLYRAGESQGIEGLAHPVRARAETLVAHTGHDHRHQYRAIDRRRCHRGDDFCACRGSAGCWSVRSIPATSSSCRAWCCWSPPAS